MATALVIEEETGTSRGLYHPHNGYYAGDFSQVTEPRNTPYAVYAPSRFTGCYYALNSDRPTR